MTAVQTALRLALRQQQTLDAAIAAANDLLVANNDEAMFATLFCALIDIRQRSWRCLQLRSSRAVRPAPRRRVRSHHIIEPTAWTTARRAIQDRDHNDAQR